MQIYGISISDRDIMKELLTMAQDGDLHAEERLIVMIRDNVMMRRISKYINKNRQVDNEDLKQEFLIGLAIGIPKAKSDVGDPIEYIIAQGIYRVKSYFRKNIIQSTIQYCGDCGSKHRMNVINGQYICKKCGSLNVSVNETNSNDEAFLENIYGGEFEHLVISEIIASTFKDTLTEGTRVYELYELMVEQSINKNNPDVKNYISELAKVMNCSNSNVLKNIKKLQDRYILWESNVTIGG